MGNLAQGVVRIAEKLLAFGNSPGNQVVDGGDAVFLGEGVDQIIFVDVGDLGQHIQGQALLEVAVNIPPDGGALLAGAGARRGWGEGEVGPPHQPHHQHFQQILTHQVIADGLVFNLGEHGAQIIEGVLTAAAAVDEAVAVIPAFAGGKLKALDSHNNVLQRAGIEADLSVLYIGIDNHHVVYGHRERELFNLKLPHAAHHVKNLRAGVGVKQTVPVSAVFGGAYI